MLARPRPHSESTHPRTARRGVAVVEFAFVAPVFFLFVLGMIEIGRGLMVANLLSNAARVGCRAAVLPSATNSDATSAVTSILTAQGIKSGTTTTVQVNGTTADVSTAVTGDTVTVVVSIPVADFTWLPGGSYLKGSLTGRYTLQRE